ncbi:hypothetical protein IFVP69_C1160086 [Vibrio parahaemolyticus]
MTRSAIDKMPDSNLAWFPVISIIEEEEPSRTSCLTSKELLESPVLIAAMVKLELAESATAPESIQLSRPRLI